jgi:hypothetical protein
MAANKMMPLGKYPDISLADARTAHHAARAQLRKGNDPMAQRKAERNAAKVKAVQESK